MATNWADPLHIKSKFLSQIPGVKQVQEAVDHNAAGRFFLENPIESFLPREYQVSSPWAGMQTDEDQANATKQKQIMAAYSAYANSDDATPGGQ